MEFKFTEENLERIEKAIKKYPTKRAAIMDVLYIAQEQNGFISYEVMKEISRILEVVEEDVLGVVTFYTMYHQRPIGKYHIQVCTNVSCMLRGAYDIFKEIKSNFQIEEGELTNDGKFSIEEVECMGSCGTAPMIAINEDYFENLTKEKTIDLLKLLK
jgi:NADH-quinone oxidoreductase E subunit